MAEAKRPLRARLTESNLFLLTAVVGIVVAFAVAWIAAGTIHAITYGQPDGNDHPYVGFLVFYAPDSSGEDVPQWYCTGALIAPSV